MTLPRGLLFDLQLAAWTKERAERRPIKLSEREQEIAVLIASGMHPNEISALLGISDKTVITHRMRIRAKLGCKDDAGIVRHVTRNNRV